jgi:hypothetical protein
MLPRSFSPEMYQSGEDRQLGTPVGRYEQYATLSGKIAFTGIFLLALSIIAATIVLVGGFDSASPSADLPLSLADFCQGIFLGGMLLSTVRHEALITLLHPKLSVEVYTDGLLYRKGRKIQAVRWEQIERIQRQCTVYRRKKKIILTRTTYTCEIAERPNPVLSAAITGVDEIGAVIERELIKRLLPQCQADYQADKPVVFSGLSLTRQTVRYYEKDVAWERVSKVEVGPEKLAIERDANRPDWLTVPLSHIANLCVLEALLEDIRREKGFALILAAGREIQDTEMETLGASGRERRTQPLRKTSWVSSLLLVILIVLVVSAETFGVISSFHNSQQPPILRRYPASISYSLHPTPQPALPYSAETVYDAFLAAGIKTSDVQYADGWYLSATYQPEGKLVRWEESYGVVLEIATFALPIEAKTDASDLLKDSVGYSVYTRNLCLFFYDSSISDAQRAAYLAVISRVCK